MTLNDSFWPDPQERKLLGRFYIAESISEILNVIFPFRFIYLFLVMERPEWAVIPLMVEMATVLVMEIPTGVVADRWGRKISVISGGLVSALGWGLIPLAVLATGPDQLLYVSFCFFLSGFGQTLVSGAQQAWVVDNLASAGRRDLVDRYFARMRSFASLGGVMAGSIALLILFSTDVTQAVLGWLWCLAAFGLLLAIAMAATIPEKRPQQQDGEPRISGLWQQTIAGFRSISRKRPLLMLAIAIVIATFSGAVADQGFDIALVTRGLDARALAPLGILDDLIGMVAPLIGVVLARRFGATRLLAVFMIIPALAVLIFFLQPGLWAVVLLFLFLVFFDSIWDPVADAHLHDLIPSAQRATIGSIVNQASGVAMVAGIGLFALLLGDRSDALQAATPDLITAFSGGVSTHVDLPTGLFGLPITDLAILLFVLAGLGAVPFLLAARVKSDGGKK
ncbi:MFS transporter [Marimonas lutisalis]|uniref:MFS transporter n=1 Tax=Marimonas lutisalis TaxID=2545756 RepID=UPI0010F6B5F9|nr:MFS transporter [Marimonas lutisalis]